MQAAAGGPSFLHSFIVVRTHGRHAASSLCLSKARVPETSLPLHRLSNQMSFKWNSVRVTDKIFFFYNRHTRYHYISSWDNCSLAKCVIFQRVIPYQPVDFSMFNSSRYNQSATNCVIDNVLITIQKRYKATKTRALFDCRAFVYV